jgi:2-oxoglutarate dehydrogenase E2 component (dihydrolipoamide succinyltransferase)
MSIIELKVPAVGESISEVTLSQWLKKDGDYIKIDDPICEFESDKATLEFPSEAEGVLIRVASEGADLKIGELVARIDTTAARPGATVSSDIKIDAKMEVKESAKIELNNVESYATGHPSPAASKILAEKNIEVSTVNGTGKDGRITKEDAQNATVSNSTTATITPVIPTVEQVKKVSSNTNFSRTEHRNKMSRMRKTISKRLVSAKNNTAMLTTFNEVDMTGLMELREKYQDRFVKKYNIKLGFMSLFAKACAKVLMEMPDVNAMLDGEDIVYHDYADISIAISTPNGLVVPPLKNVESLKFHEIEFEIKSLAEKARNNKLTLEEMQGGTFTITNGGVFGSLLSTPIINEPQSAILGMHNIQQRPIVVNGQIVIRNMMYLALSYDHRIIDGSTSVTFLVKVKQLLEDPTTLLLDI